MRPRNKPNRPTVVRGKRFGLRAPGNPNARRAAMSNTRPPVFKNARGVQPQDAFGGLPCGSKNLPARRTQSAAGKFQPTTAKNGLRRGDTSLVSIPRVPVTALKAGAAVVGSFNGQPGEYTPGGEFRGATAKTLSAAVNNFQTSPAHP